MPWLLILTVAAWVAHWVWPLVIPVILPEVLSLIALVAVVWSLFCLAVVVIAASRL